MVRLPRNEKQTHRLNSRVTLYTAGHLHTAVPHCSHSRAPIVHTAVPRENNEHGCVYLRCRAVCKLPGCVEGHPWTLGLKCDHRVWPWPWPWPWLFKVKYGICHISAKNGPIATKWKANISIEPWDSNVTIRFDLGHNIDLEFSRSNMKFAISQRKVVRLLRNERQNIDWTPGLKCDQWVWHWPWPWHLNFQGQMWSWPFGDQGQA